MMPIASTAPGNSATHNNQRPGFGENVKEKRLKGTFTRNGLLRLKCLNLIKTVISIFYGDDSRYHVAVLRLVQVPLYAC